MGELKVHVAGCDEENKNLGALALVKELSKTNMYDDDAL